MNIWTYLPRALRIWLLDQPIPEKWKTYIESSLTLDESKPEAIEEKLSLDWQTNYSIPAALVVLVVSAFILYAILK